jgi:aldehyde:ferredoxin oxidoreductase
MDYINNYNGNILIVDLESGKCDQEELENELIEGSLGGAAINLELYKKYSSRDPLIIGTGLLTSTFVPGSCAAVITGKSPVTNKIANVPLTWQTGIELKLTGFDFVVILGKSAKPVKLWIHDGLADIEDSGEWGKDVWETVDALRHNYGDDMVEAVVIGLAGENCSPLAQVSENYWGSKDKAGFGKVMGEKKLKALALRGLGAFEVADGFFDECTALTREIVTGVIKGKQGVGEIGRSLKVSEGILATIQEMTHRNNACFNCPYPCLTFLKYRESPKEIKSTEIKEPGCLITDLSGLAAFGFLGKDAPQALEQCFRFGLEPTASAMIVEKAGKKDLGGTNEELSKLTKSQTGLKEAGLPHFNGVSPWPVTPSLDTALVQALGIFSNAVPPQVVVGTSKDFSLEESPIARAAFWAKRQAIAYILGICPIFILVAPEMTEEKLAALIKLTMNWEDFSADRLSGICSRYLSEILTMQEGAGEIHSSLKLEGLEAGLKGIRDSFK